MKESRRDRLSLVLLFMALFVILMAILARGASAVIAEREHCTEELHGIAITDRRNNIYCLDPNAVLKVY